ncbi:MAG: chromosome segregation protein, partial [Abditibacteriota bacterium]|nr:chromosome segregation protein [Abditibacteriota bacterium]
ARSQSTLKAIEDARANVSEVQQNREAIQRTISTAREKRSSVQSRLGALRELEENMEGVQGGARSVLGAVKRGQLPDLYTLVADAVRAPQELENAIEVALGAGVHNLICSHDADAKTAIKWLKDNRAGRATFLPLNALRPSGAGDRTRGILRERGVLGIASELVSFAPENRVAVEYLLGRVVVVEDLDVAVAMARRCDGSARLVTLDGELVLPAGAITGGQGRQKTSGLLARKRELDELDGTINALSDELVRRENELKASAQAGEAAQSTLRATQESANELRAQIARQEREEEHLDREARRVQTHRDATEAQLKQSRTAIEAKASLQSGHEAEAQALDEQAKSLDEAVARAQTVVAQRQAEREEIASSVSEVRAEYSASQERLQAMRRAIGELERQAGEYESQIRQRQVSIERAVGEDAQIVANEADLVSRLSQLQQRRDELEALNQQGRAERAAAVQKLEEFGQQLKTTRTGLHTAEEELHRVEVRMASTETEIAEMVRRFDEEFGLTPEEALPHRDDIEQKQQALDEIADISDKIGQLGTVNVGAIQQHEQVKERLEFLTTQRTDLDNSKAQLEEIFADIDGRTRDQFMKTFSGVQAAFDELFKRVFDGGTTHLALTQPDNLLETGIELRVQPPGKGAQDISLLSGGERALTALTFMLALLRVHPSPFVVLDEVDAPLDQSNVGRFTQLLREFTDKTQFIVITHNNGTMQAADVLYGVTMQKPGISTLMSVRLVDDLAEPGVEPNGYHNGVGANGANSNGANGNAASGVSDAAPQNGVAVLNGH